MSKKTPTKSPAKSKPTKSAPASSPTANDKARSEALARMYAAPGKDAAKCPTKPARGSKPEGWENDPLENDAALEAALAKKDAPATPTTAAPDAKPAKGGGKNAKAVKVSPTAERRAKGGKGAKAPKPANSKRLSALDAAAKVLAESDRPLRAVDMIEVMHAKGLWTSPGGKTPEATLYAAIIREVTAKGKDARFKKVDRGMFTNTGKGG